MKKTNSITFLWSAALIVVFIAALGTTALLQQGDTAGRIARIYQDGVLIREVDLSGVADSYEFAVETESGYNTITVRNGGIRVSEADCSDQTCVNQGWLSGGVTPIVCLPHKLIIQFETFEPSDILDAIAE